MRTKTYLFIRGSSRLRYGVIREMLVRYVACEETRRRNKFWNVKHRNRPEYQKCRVVFSLPLLGSPENAEEFSATEKKIDVKNARNGIKWLSAFQIRTIRVYVSCVYFCLVRIFFFRGEGGEGKLTIQFTAFMPSIFCAFKLDRVCCRWHIARAACLMHILHIISQRFTYLTRIIDGVIFKLNLFKYEIIIKK